MKSMAILVKSEYLSFGLKENRYSKDGTMVSLGEIDIRDMIVDEFW